MPDSKNFSPLIGVILVISAFVLFVGDIAIVKLEDHYQGFFGVYSGILSVIAAVMGCIGGTNTKPNGPFLILIMATSLTAFVMTVKFTTNLHNMSLINDDFYHGAGVTMLVFAFFELICLAYLFFEALMTRLNIKA